MLSNKKKPPKSKTEGKESNVQNSRYQTKNFQKTLEYEPLKQIYKCTLIADLSALRILLFFYACVLEMLK